jgi:hypothetical protein
MTYLSLKRDPVVPESSIGVKKTDLTRKKYLLIDVNIYTPRIATVTHPAPVFKLATL